MNVNMISETNEILNGKDCVSKTDHSSRSDAKIRAELIQDGPMGIRFARESEITPGYLPRPS